MLYDLRNSKIHIPFVCECLYTRITLEFSSCVNPLHSSCVVKWRPPQAKSLKAKNQKFLLNRFRLLILASCKSVLSVCTLKEKNCNMTHHSSVPCFVVYMKLIMFPQNLLKRLFEVSGTSHQLLIHTNFCKNLEINPNSNYIKI